MRASGRCVRVAASVTASVAEAVSEAVAEAVPDVARAGSVPRGEPNASLRSPCPRRALSATVSRRHLDTPWPRWTNFRTMIGRARTRLMKLQSRCQACTTPCARVRRAHRAIADIQASYAGPTQGSARRQWGALRFGAMCHEAVQAHAPWSCRAGQEDVTRPHLSNGPGIGPSPWPKPKHPPRVRRLLRRLVAHACVSAVRRKRPPRCRTPRPGEWSRSPAADARRGSCTPMCLALASEFVSRGRARVAAACASARHSRPQPGWPCVDNTREGLLAAPTCAIACYTIRGTTSPTTACGGRHIRSRDTRSQSFATPIAAISAACATLPTMSQPERTDEACATQLSTRLDARRRWRNHNPPPPPQRCNLEYVSMRNPQLNASTSSRQLN